LISARLRPASTRRSSTMDLPQGRRGQLHERRFWTSTQPYAVVNQGLDEGSGVEGATTNPFGAGWGIEGCCSSTVATVACCSSTATAARRSSSRRKRSAVRSRRCPGPTIPICARTRWRLCPAGQDRHGIRVRLGRAAHGHPRPQRERDGLCLGRRPTRIDHRSRRARHQVRLFRDRSGASPTRPAA